MSFCRRYSWMDVEPIEGKAAADLGEHTDEVFAPPA